MGLEIERKFLVPETPSGLAGYHSEPIEQAYLASGLDFEIRIRSIGDRRVLTMKRGAGLERSEHEIEITDDQFHALRGLTEGNWLTKRRYRVPLGDVTAEVDIYGGDLDGLITAEVEFESVSASEAFEPPDWFGREVTGEPRFANKALSRAEARPEASE